MDYLLRWRKALAKDLFRRTDTPLAELAAKVGYQSTSAFSSAFRRCLDEPPSNFARRKLVA
jgi:AraC-like DNA-binding protein